MNTHPKIAEKWRKLHRLVCLLRLRYLRFQVILFPMMIGPGGISTVVIYTSSAHSWLDLGLVMVAGGLIALICLISLLLANKISQFLGETGLTIMNRVMGILLAAVAVEIVVTGLKDLFPMLR